MGMYTQKHFADRVGASRAQVAEWISRGMPASRLPGGAYRIDEATALQWIEEQRQGRERGKRLGASASASASQPDGSPGQRPAPAPPTRTDAELLSLVKEHFDAWRSLMRVYAPLVKDLTTSGRAMDPCDRVSLEWLVAMGGPRRMGGRKPEVVPEGPEDER